MSDPPASAPTGRAEVSRTPEFSSAADEHQPSGRDRRTVASAGRSSGHTTHRVVPGRLRRAGWRSPRRRSSRVPWRPVRPSRCRIRPGAVASLVRAGVAASQGIASASVVVVRVVHLGRRPALLRRGRRRQRDTPAGRPICKRDPRRSRCWIGGWLDRLPSVGFCHDRVDYELQPRRHHRPAAHSEASVPGGDECVRRDLSCGDVREHQVLLRA